MIEKKLVIVQFHGDFMEFEIHIVGKYHYLVWKPQNTKIFTKIVWKIDFWPISW